MSLRVLVVLAFGWAAIGTATARAAEGGGAASAPPRLAAADSLPAPVCEAEDGPSLAELRATLLDRRAPGPRRQRDRSCYASLLERRELLADPRTLVVDVRTENEFERCRIPGSIQVRLGALRTKAQWRERPLLLVNEGWTHLELEEGCQQLRGAGFTNVAILAGGLRTWRDEVGPLEGELGAQARLSRIPPSVFTRERAYDSWLVLDVSAPGESEVGEWLPEAVRVPYARENGGAERFLGALRDVLRERQRARPDTTLVFVDAQPKRYALLERELADRALPPALYLEGGLPEYRAYHGQRAAVLAQRARSEERRSCAAR